MSRVVRRALRDAHEYRRSPPSLFNLTGDEHMVGWAIKVLSEAKVECPEEYYEVISDCYVYEAAFISVGSPPQWHEQSVVDFGVKDQILPLIVDGVAKNHHLKEYLAKEGRRTVVIAKTGYRNYGHFMVEIAPKFCNLARADLGPVNILVPNGMDLFMPVMKGLCEALNLDAEFSVFEGSNLSSYSEIYYFGPVSKHGRRKSQALMDLKSVLLEMAGAASGSTDRDIYIKRGGNDARQMPIGFDEMISNLGFEVVVPASLTFDEQVRLFSSARRIVGPVGAGMTNMLYARPGCEVFVIDPGLMDFFFWDLCNFVGGKFYWYFSSPLAPYTLERAKAPIDLPLDELRYTLKRIGWA